MNKTVNINLAGIFFHIDEDAYLKLQGYLEAIKKSFSNTEGYSEIITDIEARISELFNERIKSGREVVGVKEVDEVIVIMGQPEDYLVDDDIFEDEPKFNVSQESTSQKKIFRDTENSYISGVSSGLAHYLSLNSIWVRLLWILLVMMSFGTFVIIYILLWVLIPAAKSTADKIMMTGDPVNIDNIEKQIKDSFDKVSGVAKNVSESVSNTAKKHGVTIKSTSKNFFDAIADMILFVFKIFSKFVGMILITFNAMVLLALILGLFSIGAKNILNIPGLDYIYAVNAANTPIWLASLLVFFTIGIPIFFLFYLGLKIMIDNLKSIGKIAKLTLLGVWLFSVLGIMIVTVRETSEHSRSEIVTIKNIINIKAQDTLRIEMKNNDLYRNYNYSNNGFKIANDISGIKNIYRRDIKFIVKSTTDSLASIVIEKKADGSNYEKAINYAKNLNYNYSYDNKELVLDTYLFTDIKNKFRDQQVKILLYLPEGVVIHNSSKVSHFNWHTSIINRKQANHYLKVIKDNVECLNCNEDYSVKIKTPKIKIDEEGVEINGDEGSLTINKNGLKVESKEIKLTVSNQGVVFLEKTQDQDIIKDVAYTDSEAIVRLEALKKLTNESYIKHVAYTDREAIIRLEALKLLKKQNYIKHVAYTDREAAIRLEALKKLTNQIYIKHIACTDKEAGIRLAALKKITNRESISHIAKTDSDPDIRLAALKFLK